MVKSLLESLFPILCNENGVQCRAELTEMGKEMGWWAKSCFVNLKPCYSVVAPHTWRYWVFATPLPAHLQELRVSLRSLGTCLLPGISVGLGILLGSFLGTFFPPVDLRAQKVQLTDCLLLRLAGLLVLSRGQRHPSITARVTSTAPIRRLRAQAPPASRSLQAILPLLSASTT